MSLTSSQLTALRSLLDRIIPADDFPGALAAGTDTYVLRHVLGDGSAGANVLLLGFSQLDAETVARHGAHQTFATLLPPQQDSLLADLAAARPMTSWPPRWLPPRGSTASLSSPTKVFTPIPPTAATATLLRGG